MIVHSDIWSESLQSWLLVASEVAGPDAAAEARGLQEFLATCDEDERAEYFASYGVELGST